MALSQIKNANSTEAVPQVWLAKAGVTIWKGAVVGRYPFGANAGYIDNIGADESLIVVGVAENNCGTSPAGYGGPAFQTSTRVLEMIWPMGFSTNSDSSTAQRGQIVYGIDENSASMTSTDGKPIGVFMESDSSTSGRVAIGPSFLAGQEGLMGIDLSVGTALTDAGSTSIARAGRITWVTLPSIPLTANRSYALPALTACMPGDRVKVTRLDTAAFTAAFTDSGSGTATLLTMPASKVNSAEFVVNAAGTHWLLVSCGVQ